MNFLRNHKLESDSLLSKHFMPHQLAWIQAERLIHKHRQQVVALAEKSVRIGWTFADGFKNVRKRIVSPNRDYLFATKDYPSALEYVRQCYSFAEIFNLTRSIVSHGEESISVNRLDESGRPSAFTEDLKVGIIKFDNGSRIIAFSANPQAMAVYGGDVGLDEFAKHPNARLLWETAQGRVTWNYDLAVWSSHDGEDTLFNEFAREARAACLSGQAINPLAKLLEQHNEPAHSSAAPNSTPIQNQNSDIKNPGNINSPWNLYFRVTMPEAIQLGLVDTINKARGTKLSATQFLADCRARARDEGIFEQTYLCNPLGASANHIVDWSAVERCRGDFDIDRVHLEADEIVKRFGSFNPAAQSDREAQIKKFLHSSFPTLFSIPLAHRLRDGLRVRASSDSPQPSTKNPQLRLGFDVAASGQGDLACIYIDQANGDELSLRGLFTCRTEDWHFLKTVLFSFLKELPNLKAAGDESGLGRQICWEAAEHFSNRFTKVNFGAKKHDLGFALMNQLSTAQKRIPRAHQDIASDLFALRKVHNGSKWVFTEGPNSLNPVSHCDIAWAAALSTEAHTHQKGGLYAAVLHDNGWSDHEGFHFFNDAEGKAKILTPQERLLWSDDPRIWKPLRW